jgi:class 3 adenylate cyclase
MSDLPLHTFQRDAIFLGEHMYSGIRSAHKLDKISRKLAYEHNLSNSLLYSMLPQDVAQTLRNGNPYEPKHHENVTLFFSDVVGFTNLCSQLPPWDIVDMLNRLYTVMDFLADRFKLYKVETVSLNSMNYFSIEY